MAGCLVPPTFPNADEAVAYAHSHLVQRKPTTTARAVLDQSLLMPTPPVSDQVRNSSKADLVKAAYFSRTIE